MWEFLEFFAGGGMAGAGLGNKWKCTFTNDISQKKGAAYSANWGNCNLVIEDINKLTTSDIPGMSCTCMGLGCWFLIKETHYESSCNCFLDCPQERPPKRGVVN